MKLNNAPCIVSDDILLFDPGSGLSKWANTISGSFTYPSGQKPCSIMINKGKDICSSSCHGWLGFPETVLYKYTDGTFGIGKFVNTSEIPNRSKILWAVGGMGLLDKYNPLEEGFGKFVKNGKGYDYSDVIRLTSHTLIGVKNNKIYLCYIMSMTGSQVNAYAKLCGFEKSIMLDGGHISSINSTDVKINTSTVQGYAIQGVSTNFAPVEPIKEPVNEPVVTSSKFKTNLTTVNFVKGRKSTIKYIVVHYTANDGDTDEGNGKYFNNYYRGASAHYFVDEDSVTQVVKDSDTAWHCNDTQKYTNGGATFKKLCNNDNSLGIELCSDKTGNEYILTADTQSNAQELIRALINEHVIPVGNVIRHYDVSGKICPEPFVTHPEQWIAFKKGILVEPTIVKEFEPVTEVGKLYRVIEQHASFTTMSGAERMLADLKSQGKYVWIEETIK